jgi:hypothetical protein
MLTTYFSKKYSRVTKQPGYLLILERPVAFRPRLTAGLAFTGTSNFAKNMPS